MIPDYEPTVPEWFHQQFELDRFLAETQERADAEQRKANKSRRRYFAGTAICWLIASLILLISTRTESPVPDKPVPAQPRIPEVAKVNAPSDPVYIQAQNSVSPVMSESNELKQVLNELGAIEVQGSLYTHTGESYSGPLWVRKVRRGDTVYLEDAALFEIDGTFRLTLPSNSTVYVYAPAEGLDWNGGWGVPIQTPPSAQCSDSRPCAIRLEDLIASTAK